MSSPEYLSTSTGRYLCQPCGKDITKLIRPWSRGGHGAPRIGLETFECTCGKSYKTGAIEWDHLNSRSKEIRIRGLATAGFFIVGFFGFVPAVLVLITGRGFSLLSSKLEARVLSSFLWGAGVGMMIVGYLLLGFVYDIWTSVRRAKKLGVE